MPHPQRTKKDFLFNTDCEFSDIDDLFNFKDFLDFYRNVFRMTNSG